MNPNHAKSAFETVKKEELENCEVFWHKNKANLKNQLLSDIQAQVKKLEEFNLVADPSFSTKLKQLDNFDSDEIAELKMSFNLIKADLQLKHTEPHESNLQKLMLNENLRGLIECVTSKESLLDPQDLDKRIKALMSDMGQL